MMWLCYGWGWHPPQTASYIHITHTTCLSTLICCPLAYSSSLTQLYPSYLAQILRFFCVTCGVKMMSLCRGSQTASHIHITHIQSVWAHWYAVHWHTHTVIALHSCTAHILGFWVTCGVNMMSTRCGWGWGSPQTASPIHIRHIQSVWAHWYAVLRHTVTVLHSYTHPTWLIFWGPSVSLVLVDSKWCDYVMVEADRDVSFFMHYWRKTRVQSNTPSIISSEVI
jgi:hypothetical protein